MSELRFSAVPRACLPSEDGDEEQVDRRLEQRVEHGPQLPGDRAVRLPRISASAISAMKPRRSHRSCRYDRSGRHLGRVRLEDVLDVAVGPNRGRSGRLGGRHPTSRSSGCGSSSRVLRSAGAHHLGHLGIHHQVAHRTLPSDRARIAHPIRISINGTRFVRLGGLVDRPEDAGEVAHLELEGVHRLDRREVLARRGRCGTPGRAAIGRLRRP